MEPIRDASNDLTLWEQFRQGDTRAFADLYAEYHPHLLRFGIHYCNDPELARDTINQQFLRLWDRRAELPPVANLKSYLLTAFRNSLINALKKADLPEPDPGIELDTPSREQELIGLQDQERLLASVKKAIRELAPRQRQVVLLRYYQGLPADEIARRTGLSTRTVYNTLHTALGRLRDALGPRHSGQLDRLLSLLVVMA